MPDDGLAANLPPKPLKILKTLHLICMGLVMGAAAGLLTSLRLMYTRGDNLDHLTADMFQASLVNGLFMWALYGLLATAIAFSLFSSWGFFRHTWIVLKWVGLTLMVFCSTNWLIPAVDGMAALSDGLYSIPDAGELYSSLFRQATTMASLVIGIGVTLSVLSVFKPFGLWQRRQPSRQKTIIIRMIILLLAGGAVAASLMQSAKLQTYRQMEISHVEPAFIRDGVYRGVASDGPFTYQVDVTVKGKTIVEVTAVSNRATPYARYAEGVFSRVLNNQSPAVDAITRATTSSKMLLKAVENALSGATRSEE
ncbi:MAG: FMN-binding protein [Deltaproteobacteria bacterium]|nr:FMN-binding protein [Deltaproteobacteria bacterium]MBW2519943.1 FMN-binding protein [Deltaproteobacteria bacterium]